FCTIAVFFSHCLYRLSDLSSGLGGPVGLRRHRASRQDTPWTECQPIAGHNTHSLTQSHTTLEIPVSLEACLWTVGGNWSSRRKPTKHGENMQNVLEPRMLGPGSGPNWFG
ncbi:hypothetical protein QTP70_020945, partial [Hemibagrus guttatus]